MVDHNNLPRLEQMRESANDSSRHVRNVYITFLFLLAYIAITISATTDEQLLKVSPVVLPILNVNIPIIGFYTLVPWLLLFIHFNLLLQCYFLARNLHFVDAAIRSLDNQKTKDLQISLIFPFSFNHMILRHYYGGIISFLLQVIIWFTVMLLPTGLLMWTQIAFLPYHSVDFTWGHRITIALNILLIWVFFPIIITPPHDSRAWWIRFGKGFYKKPALVLIIVNALVQIQRRKMRKKLSSLWRLIRFKWHSIHAYGSSILLLISVSALFFSFFIATVPGESIEVLFAKRAPVSWLTEKSVYTDNRCFYPTFIFFDRRDALFHRNLRLRGKILIANDPSPDILYALRSGDASERNNAYKNIIGLNLTNRDLRYSYMPYTVMPAADLRGANLEGSYLMSIDLTDAKLDLKVDPIVKTKDIFVILYLRCLAKM